MPEFTIQIDAPPELIFDELSHVEQHPSWANPEVADDDGTDER
jgi:hypothetical protein